MNKSKIILINNEEVEIKKMAVGQFAKLMLAVENIPEIISKNFNLEDAQKLDMQTLFKILPNLLANSQDEIFKILEVASGIRKEQIAELDYEELLDVITAILELNNFKGIIAKIKNLKQVLQQK